MTTQASDFQSIPLTKGKSAIVDASDFEWLSQWKWCASIRSHARGYIAVRRYLGRRILMHRLILGVTPEELVDHINHNPLDNRRANLRIATIQENNRNISVTRRNNKSGFKGVSWCKRQREWVVFLSISKKNTYIGRANSPEAGARMYDAKAKEVFGAFAQLNFPSEGEAA